MPVLVVMMPGLKPLAPGLKSLLPRLAGGFQGWFALDVDADKPVADIWNVLGRGVRV